MIYSNKVLIAEDKEYLRRLIFLYFRKESLEIDICANCSETLEKILEARKSGLSYPVIITDLRIPVLDGVELIKEVNRKVERGEILRPDIYVMTAYHEREDELRKIDLVKGFFYKPFSWSELTNSIRWSLQTVRQTQRSAD
ncbi:MAG: response regulator [Candidatus Pacearchaeota archaeon]